MIECSPEGDFGNLGGKLVRLNLLQQLIGFIRGGVALAQLPLNRPNLLP